MQDDAENLGLQRIGPLTNNMRGKHTTRHVSLLEVLRLRECKITRPLDVRPRSDVSYVCMHEHNMFRPWSLQVAGGLLADSPGFNQPSLDKLTPGNLPKCFPEIRIKSEE